jgi:hypothetical protein
MTKKRCLRLGTAILAALLVTSGFSFAAETGADAPTKAKGETGLMDANQAMNNPITSYTLFIVENDTTANQGSITTENRYLNTTLIEPLIPLSIGESGWRE